MISDFGRRVYPSGLLRRPEGCASVLPLYVHVSCDELFLAEPSA